jgi:HPt (histidine-containing phosphotransfer) domain-containing protein
MENLIGQAGIDAKALIDFVRESGLDEEDMHEFVAAFVDDAPARLAALRAACALADAAAIASAAHAFKSPASLICARRLAALLGGIEDSARQGGLPHVTTIDAVEAETRLISSTATR